MKLIILLALLAVATQVAGCARAPTQPEPVATIGTVDYKPTWSLDGGTIAFVRRLFSSAGPPGVYVVSSQGGEPRYVAPANIIWPQNLRISPDGKQIACTYEFQIYLLDAGSATYRRLSASRAWADHPEWSPDGRFILFNRFYDRLFPSDSAGFTIIDLQTSEEQVVRPTKPLPYGLPFFSGEDPRWSRDGTSFAWIQPMDTGTYLVAANVDGSAYSVLDSAPQLQSLHRYFRPSSGQDGLLYGKWRSGMRYMEWDGSGSSPFPFLAHKQNTAFSPDGEWVVRVETDVSNNLNLLFVRRVDDITGASRRQLTFWLPPETLAVAKPLPSPPTEVGRQLPYAPRVADVSSR